MRGRVAGANERCDVSHNAQRAGPPRLPCRCLLVIHPKKSFFKMPEKGGKKSSAFFFEMLLDELPPDLLRFSLTSQPSYCMPLR